MPPTTSLVLRSHLFPSLRRIRPMTSRAFSTSSSHLSSRPSLSSLLPPSSWDSHLHITDPQAFPPSSSATYAVHSALLPGALANSRRLHLPNLVLVQPSTYGYDNACILHYLDVLNKTPLSSALGGEGSTATIAATTPPQQQTHKARAVVCIDPLSKEEHYDESTSSGDGRLVSKSTLHAWHSRGVRGVRINLKSVGASLSKSEIEDLINAHARRIEAAGLGGWKGWCVQVYVGLKDVVSLEEVVERWVGGLKAGGEGGGGGEEAESAIKGVKIMIDHMGAPTSVSSIINLAAEVEGWKALKRLLKLEGVWTKISAPYRILSTKESRKGKKGLEGAADVEELEGMVKELLGVRGGRGCIFASDWPHTRFEAWEGDEDWVRACERWAREVGGEVVVERLFRWEAERVWDGVEEEKGE